MKEWGSERTIAATRGEAVNGHRVRPGAARRYVLRELRQNLFDAIPVHARMACARSGA